MTIKKLIEELTEYAEAFDGYGMEVKGYIGMTAEVAKSRLENVLHVDEYVLDDFLSIEYLNSDDDFVYVVLEEVKE